MASSLFPFILIMAVLASTNGDMHSKNGDMHSKNGDMHSKNGKVQKLPVRPKTLRHNIRDIRDIMKKIEDMLHTLPNPKLRALRSSLDKISYALMIKETTHGHDPDELIHKIENAISKTTGDIGRTGEMEEPKGANTDYSDYSDYYDYTPGTSSGRFGYLNGPRNAGGRIPSPQDRMMMGGPPSMNYQFNPSLGNLQGEERNFKA